VIHRKRHLDDRDELAAAVYLGGLLVKAAA
jgi:hypothetical protein